MRRTGSLRFSSLIGLTALAFLFVIFSVYQLQIGSGDYYASRVFAYDSANEAFAAKRGNIYLQDKDGETIPAALTYDYPLIFAVPNEIEDPAAAASLLSSIIPLESSVLVDMLSKPNDQYELLIPKAGEEQVLALKELNLKGIYIGSRKERSYPFKALASQTIGFVGMTDKDDFSSGRYGVEAFYEEKLSGTDRSFNPEGVLTEAIDGQDVVLTINRDVQARAEDVLSSLVERYSAIGGTVIVQDPKTGAIIAMGNYPNFDLNNYSKADVADFINPGVQAIYEPGSIFKILTIAAGIDSGSFTPDTVYHDVGEVVLNGRTIKNWDLKAHGDVTMANGIEQSINTALVFAEQQIGHEKFYNYLLKFGIKDKTNIDLPGEIIGSLKPLEEVGRDINFATAAFGQGVAVTPIRLISALSAIANDGVMMRPFVNAQRGVKVERRVISKEAADTVTDIMVSAVKKNYVADIPHYDVAAKTGTAQVPDFKNGGYLDEAVINTYIGFAPASDPAFTILIKLDQPKGAPLAGQTVVPAFKELAQFLLNYYSVPPDRLED